MQKIISLLTSESDRSEGREGEPACIEEVNIMASSVNSSEYEDKYKQETSKDSRSNLRWEKVVSGGYHGRLFMERSGKVI